MGPSVADSGSPAEMISRPGTSDNATVRFYRVCDANKTAFKN